MTTRGFKHRPRGGAAGGGKKVKIYTILLVSAALALSSCETSTSVNNVPTSPSSLAMLPSGTWGLIAFEPRDGSAVTVEDPARYTVEFGDDSAVHIRADCNQCNGNYESRGAFLELGLLACTLAACPPQSLADPYLAALGAASSYAASNGELLVAYADGVLRFSPQ